MSTEIALGNRGMDEKALAFAVFSEIGCAWAGHVADIVEGAINPVTMYALATELQYMTGLTGKYFEWADK